MDQYTRQKRRTPEFELQDFFGQLQCILVIELPSTPQLNLAMPTTIILALIKNVKATLMDNIYYYKEPGVNEVVNLTMVQCVVGRIWDRDEWAIIDRSYLLSHTYHPFSHTFLLSSYHHHLTYYQIWLYIST